MPKDVSPQKTNQDWFTDRRTDYRLAKMYLLNRHCHSGVNNKRRQNMNYKNLFSNNLTDLMVMRNEASQTFQDHNIKSENMDQTRAGSSMEDCPCGDEARSHSSRVTDAHCLRVCECDEDNNTDCNELYNYRKSTGSASKVGLEIES